MNGYIAGIDLGSSKVCAALGKLDKQDKLQIIGVTTAACSGIKKGIVVDIDSTSESINNCIEQLERMTDIHVSEAYVSLSGGICELIPSKGVVAVSSEDREIKKSDIERVLKAARIISVSSDKEAIGVVPKQYIVDGYENIQEPLGMSGLRLEVEANVVLAKSTIVNNVMKAINSSGIEVRGIVLEPLAVSEVVLRKDEAKLGTAIVDVGAEKIDISVFVNSNIIYTDTIPYGGNTITNDISVCLKVPFSESDKLKIKYGTLEVLGDTNIEPIKIKSNYNDMINIDYHTLNEIVYARVEELLGIVKEKLIKSGFYNEITGVVIVGGGLSFFKGISSLGRQVFSKPVRVGSPEFVGASSPSYTTVVGIIQDIVNNTVNANSASNRDENTISSLNNKKNIIHEKVLEEDFNIEETSLFSRIKGFLADFF